MSSTRVRTAIVLFVLSIGIIIWWALSGHNVFTSTEHMVQVKDELFGTTTETWVKQFMPGLDMVGPIAALLTGTGVWLLFSARKRARIGMKLKASSN